MARSLDQLPTNLRRACEKAIARDAAAEAERENRRRRRDRKRVPRWERAETAATTDTTQPESIASPRRRKARAKGRHAPGEMNKAEARYWAELQSRVRSGELAFALFEGVKLRIGDRCWYTPDFYVETAEGEIEVHEVKAQRRRPSGKMGAHWEDDARVKLKAAAALLASWRFVVVSWNKKEARHEFEEIKARQTVATINRPEEDQA